MPWESLAAVASVLVVPALFVVAFVRRRRLRSSLLDPTDSVPHDQHSLDESQPQVTNGRPPEEPWPRRD